MHHGKALEYILEQKEISYSELGRRLGVSSTAARKHKKTSKINKRLLRTILGTIGVTDKYFDEIAVSFESNVEGLKKVLVTKEEIVLKSVLGHGIEIDEMAQEINSLKTELAELKFALKKEGVIS